jgi:hypothetical protein
MQIGTVQDYVLTRDRCELQLSSNLLLRNLTPG